MKIPFRRGDDGLTDRQRSRYAKRYAEGAGRKPTAEEMSGYREAGTRQRDDGCDCGFAGCTWADA